MKHKNSTPSPTKRMLLSLLFLFLVLIGIGVIKIYPGVKKQVLAQQDSPVHAFVLVGQSNMVGQGDIPLVQFASGNIFKWDNSAWVTGIEPVHYGKFGPSMSFALELLKLKNDANYKIGLIPCAKGGTSITEWQKGQTLYTDCLNKVKAVQANGAVIEGMLMSQGEADSETKQAANAWGGLAIQFAIDFRSDYGKPYSPFIFAQLGYDPNANKYPYWMRLHNLQPEILSGHGNFRMIVTDDLPKNSDKIHFNHDSQVTIGQRFARAMCQVIGCP